MELSEEDKQELQALLVGFLQQSLKEYPSGMSLHTFERIFPEKCDEPPDWYKRFKLKNACEALRLMPHVAKLTSQYGGQILISLNKAGGACDAHLCHMVEGQRGKRKVERRPFSMRQPHISRHSFGQYSARYSYSNRNSGSSHFSYSAASNRIVEDWAPTIVRPASNNNKANNNTRPTSSLQQSLQSSGEQRRQSNKSDISVKSDFATNPTTTTTPTTHASDNRIAATHSSKSTPQETTKGTLTQALPPTPNTKTLDKASSTKGASGQDNHVKTGQNVTGKKEHDISKSQNLLVKPPAPKDSEQHKNRLRQRILDLFTRISAEIILIYLPSIYQIEYEETLDPTEYGYDSLTSLLKDDQLRNHVEIKYKQPYATIAPRLNLKPEGKENVFNSSPSDDVYGAPLSNGNHGQIASQEGQTSSQFEAMASFNLKTMQWSLPASTAPFRKTKDISMPIDDEIKYKTFRMILMRDDPYVIDNWQNEFESLTKLSIKVSQYGFKNCEEFFRELAKDLPIKIWIDSKGILVASMTSRRDVADWLEDQMSKSLYKSLYVLSEKYELIATPMDRYTFRKISSEMMLSAEFQPVVINSAKNPSHIWLRLNTTRMIEDLLTIEASMCAYKDYSDSTMLPGLPKFYVKEGFPCALYDQHLHRWCRAIIISKDQEKSDQTIDKIDVNVLLVDYGIIRKSHVKQLSCILKQHMRTPVVPILCYLHGVEPALSDTDGPLWSSRATVIIHEYVNPPSVLACRFVEEKKICAAVRSKEYAFMPEAIWGVELCDTRGNEDCFIHISLIEAGLAVTYN